MITGLQKSKMSSFQLNPTECRSGVLGSQNTKITPDVRGKRAPNTKTSLVKEHGGEISISFFFTFRIKK